MTWSRFELVGSAARAERVDPAFAEVACTLTPGEVSPVVETSLGYHLVTVHERTRPMTRPLTDVRGEIEAL